MKDLSIDHLLCPVCKVAKPYWKFPTVTHKVEHEDSKVPQTEQVRDPRECRACRDARLAK